MSGCTSVCDCTSVCEYECVYESVRVCVRVGVRMSVCVYECVSVRVWGLRRPQVVTCRGRSSSSEGLQRKPFVGGCVGAWEGTGRGTGDMYL